MSDRPKIKAVRKAVSQAAYTFSSADIKALHDASRLGAFQCIRLDRTYRCVSKAAWSQVLAWSRVDRYDYEAELRDCDNYAAMLHGQVALKFKLNTCGYIIDTSGSHAYNAIVYYDGDTVPTGVESLKIGIVEPQTDGFFSPLETPRNAEMYAALRGITIWA